jgi:hypothetical protein
MEFDYESPSWNPVDFQDYASHFESTDHMDTNYRANEGVPPHLNFIPTSNAIVSNLRM